MSGRIWAQLVHLGMNIGTRADAEKHEVLGCDDGEWRIITDRMAANRLNMIVIDLLEGVRYPSHPEIGAKGAWSVEKLRSELKRLRAMGLKLAVGSSSRNTPLILERIGLGHYFDRISDGNNITRSKPDPQVFTMAAEMLGLAPARCLVVEDAEAGSVQDASDAFSQFRKQHA